MQRPPLRQSLPPKKPPSPLHQIPQPRKRPPLLPCSTPPLNQIPSPPPPSPWIPLKGSPNSILRKRLDNSLWPVSGCLKILVGFSMDPFSGLPDFPWRQAQGGPHHNTTFPGRKVFPRNRAWPEGVQRYAGTILSPFPCAVSHVAPLPSEACPALDQWGCGPVDAWPWGHARPGHSRGRGHQEA